MKAIAGKVSTKTASHKFITTLRRQSHPIQDFDVDLWGALFDHTAIYSKDDISITFRDGIKI